MTPLASSHVVFMLFKINHVLVSKHIIIEDVCSMLFGFKLGTGSIYGQFYIKPDVGNLKIRKKKSLKVMKSAIIDSY